MDGNDENAMVMVFPSNGINNLKKEEPEADVEGENYGLALSMLPVEILKRMAMFLSPEDLITFTTTSKHIKSSLNVSVLPSRRFIMGRRSTLQNNNPQPTGDNQNNHGNNEEGGNNNDAAAPIDNRRYLTRQGQPREEIRLPLLYNQTSNTVITHSINLNLNWSMRRARMMFGVPDNRNATITRRFWLIGHPKVATSSAVAASTTTTSSNNLEEENTSTKTPFDGGRVVYEFTSTLRLRDIGPLERLQIPFMPKDNEIYSIWFSGEIEEDAANGDGQQPQPPLQDQIELSFSGMTIKHLIFDMDDNNRSTFLTNYKALKDAGVLFGPRKLPFEGPKKIAITGTGHGSIVSSPPQPESKMLMDLLLSTCQSLRKRMETSNEQPDTIMSTFLDKYGILKSISSFRSVEDMVQTECNDFEISRQRQEKATAAAEARRRVPRRQQRNGNQQRNNNGGGHIAGAANITITVGQGGIGQDPQVHRFNLGDAEPVLGAGRGNGNNGGADNINIGQPQVFVHRVGGGGGGAGDMDEMFARMPQQVRDMLPPGLFVGGGMREAAAGMAGAAAGAREANEEAAAAHEDAESALARARAAHDPASAALEQARSVRQRVDAAAEGGNDNSNEGGQAEEQEQQGPARGDDEEELGIVVDVDMDEESQEGGATANNNNDAQQEQIDMFADELAPELPTNEANPPPPHQQQQQQQPMFGGIPPEVQNMLPPGLLENMMRGGVAGGGVVVGGGAIPGQQQQAGANVGNDANDEDGPQHETEVHVVELPIHVADGDEPPDININLPGMEGAEPPQVFFGGANVIGGGGGGLPPGMEQMIFQQIGQMMGDGGGGAMAGMNGFQFPPPPNNHDGNDDDSIPEVD